MVRCDWASVVRAVWDTRVNKFSPTKSEAFAIAMEMDSVLEQLKMSTTDDITAIRNEVVADIEDAASDLLGPLMPLILGLLLISILF